MRMLSAVMLIVMMATPLAAEPSWSGSVIARGPQRERLLATPITERPYRPFHFYGNAVRRNYHRGTILPAPRDFIDTGTSLFSGQ